VSRIQPPTAPSSAKTASRNFSLDNDDDSMQRVTEFVSITIRNIRTKVDCTVEVSEDATLGELKEAVSECVSGWVSG
jgi:hypothetical protein